MKIFNKMIVLASATLAQDGAEIDTISTTSIGSFDGGNKPGGMGLGRQYHDLKAMVIHYNPDFNEREYWAYGCNCFILGDRPLGSPGYGQPVDALDMVCKQYKVNNNNMYNNIVILIILILFPKDCQKCVRREYGDQCIGEFVKYDWRVRRGQPECTNEPGTCERNLCECDLDFARKMPSQYEVFDVKYHLFWSPENWTPEEQCQKVRKFSDFQNFQFFF